MKKISLIILSISVLLPVSLMADLLVYEGFDYPAGVINGSNGGIGWTGAWTNSNQSVVAESLGLPNLMISRVGGSMATNSGGTTNRTFPGVDLAQDGVYYISYLCSRTGWTAGSSQEQLDLHLRNTSFLQIAAWGISSSERFETLNIGSTKSAAGADSTDVFFMVGKLVTRAAGNDEIYLKAYTGSDEIPTVEPDVWTVSGGVEENSELANMFTIWPGSTTGYSGQIDEIRLGTAWADVVATPYISKARNLYPMQDGEVFSPVTFTWQAPSAIEAPTYKLYFSSDFGQVDPNDATADAAPVTLTETSYGPQALSSNVTYYWRVDVVDGENTVFGNIGTFSILAPIAPVAPVNGDINQARNLTLNWESLVPITGDYEVYIGDSEESLVYVGDSTGTTFAPAGLEWGQTYYWQVVYNDGVDVIASAVWSFTVAAGPVCDGTLVGDINNDCLTNLADFAIMAAEWLDCTVTNAADCN